MGLVNHFTGDWASPVGATLRPPPAAVRWLSHRFSSDAKTGRGPGGWDHCQPLKRVSAWSSLAVGPDGQSHGWTILNETAVLGEHIVLSADSAAAYLHIDDGGLLADPAKDLKSLSAPAALEAVCDKMDEGEHRCKDLEVFTRQCVTP